MHRRSLYTDASGESHFRDTEAGEIILVEDATGKGRLSQSPGKMRHGIFIPVD